MNETVIYRPYKTSGKVGIPLTVALGCFFLAGALFCTAKGEGVAAAFCVTACIFCAFEVQSLYNCANVTLFFEQEGLRIAGGSYKNYCFLPWEQLPCACYVRNLKGFLFCILSSEPLSAKEAGKIARRSFNLSRVWMDPAVVICLDPMQDTSAVRGKVADCVARVDDREH